MRGRLTIEAQTVRAKAAGCEAGDSRLVDGDYVIRLRSLVAVTHGILDPRAVAQAAVPLSADRAEMNKHILAAVASNEAESLGCIEPLHVTAFSSRTGLLG